MDQRQLQIVLKLQDEASKELRRLSGEFGVAEQKTTGWGNALTFVKGTLIAVAAAAGTAAIAGIKMGIDVAAQLETAQVGLTTLLGDSEKAAKTIDRLKKEAKRTPFELPGLSQATQLLTSVTKDGDKSIDILLDVGEALAAMGKGQAELDRIIVNLQQIAATGRAATIDIRQFAFAGIPIYEMLAETTGKTGEALEELISSGGVTFDLLVEMFDKANDSGGRFFGAFENQSGTFNQAVSNMKDSLGIFFADIVTQTGLFKFLTDALVTASNFLGDYKQHIQDLIGFFREFLQQLDQQTGFVTLLTEAWSYIVDVFKTETMPAFKELWEALQPFKPYLESLIQVFGLGLVGAIGLTAMAITGLVGLLTKFITLSVEISTNFLKILKPALETIGQILLNLSNIIQTVINNFGKMYQAATQAFSVVSNPLGAGIKLGSNIVNSILPGRANGGPVTAGMPYMVGERGPEMFVPRTSGNIVPNGGMGGVTINVYGDVSGRELIEKVQEGIMSSLRFNQKLA